MAISLDSFLVNPSFGGNNSIAIGGRHNTLSTAIWTDRLCNATAMTGLITLTPLGTLQTSTLQYGCIFGNQADNTFQGTFRCEVVGGSTNRLSFQCWDGRTEDGNQQYSRRADTIDPVLVTDRTIRVGFRWRASDQRIEIWIDGREQGVIRMFLRNGVVVPGPVIGAPLHLTQELSAMGPIEIGGVSHQDRRPLSATYAEAALFNGWLSTADMIRYGRGWSPALLTSAVGIVYVDLRSDQPPFDASATGFGTAGTVVDRFSGTVYGGSAQGTVTYGGIFEHYTRTNHPAVWEEPPPTETDEEAAPTRYFEKGELDLSALGVRSGTPPTLVATGPALTAALLAANYGDTILVDHTASATAMTLTGSMRLRDPATMPITATTPRCPPRSQRLLSGRVPLLGAAAPATLGVPSCESCEPAWVLVQSTSTLPAITFRDVPLRAGATVSVLDESSRVSDAHYGQMALVRQAANNAPIFVQSANPFNGVAFRGLHLQATITQSGGGPLLAFQGPDSGPLSWNNEGNPWKMGRRLLFNQCAFEADPLNTGCSSSDLGSIDGAYHGIVNSFCDKFWNSPGGDAKLLYFGAHGGGPGHYENNHWRTSLPFYFTGGGGSSVVNANPSNFVLRRNWLGPPLSWWPSEVIGNSTRPMNISEPRTSAVRVSGTWAGQFYQHPGPTGIMTDRASGIARPYTGGDFSATTAVTLTDPWPTTATGILCTFQRTTPDPQTTPTVYNSGTVTPMPTATITVGSRHVTITGAPLPAAVTIGHYFYPNSTTWDNQIWSSGPILWTPPPEHSGWGFHTGITRARAKRKMITAIDPTRFGFDFDPTQDAYTAQDITDMGGSGATYTFPFSIVRHDGVYRDAQYHYKGSWENKRGVRWTIEGNVYEHTTNRCYVNNQTSNGFIPGTLTISGNTATLSGGTWPSLILFYAPMRAWYGAPYPYVLLFAGTTLMEYYPAGRIIWRITSPTTADLLPHDPRRGTQPADFTGPAVWNISGTNWTQIDRFIFRYNIFHRGTPAMAWYAESSYTGDAMVGGHGIHHDNLLLRPGDRSVVDGRAAGTIWTAPGGNTGGASVNYGPNGQAVYDDPFMPIGQGRWASTHNSAVRIDAAGGAGILNPSAGGAAWTPKTQNVDFSDNLTTNHNQRLVVSIGNNPIVSTRDMWGKSTSMARNVFGGTTLPTLGIGIIANHPDNATVLPDQLGLPATWATAADGWSLANYALTDVATVGTFTIGADGLHAVQTAGTMPAAVVPGQMVKTTTHPELHRVLNIGPLFRTVAVTETWPVADVAGSLTGTNVWDVTAGPAFGITGGRARLVGPQASGQAARCTVNLGTSDMEVEATLTELAFATNAQVNVITRKDASATQTYWRWGTSNSINGNPATMFYRLLPVIAGVVQFGQGIDFRAADNITPTLMPTVGDVIALRSVGTTHRAYLNGRLMGEVVSALIPTGTFGGISAACSGAGDVVSVDNWVARTASGGSGLVWDGLPHQEAGATGKSLVFTFKGSARDGTDPGADLAGLALMTQGVRDLSKTER